MDDECLCLTWNNHASNYQQMLNLLRIENILTDCTLACDGQKFSVHRLVLVTCSDFFRSLLGDVPCQHPIIYLRSINSREMKALIDFMYLGKIDVPQKEVPDLLSTAEALQIKGLGVLNSDCKEEFERSSCKRKRSRLASESLKAPSRIDNLSSQLPKHGACESIYSERDYPSPKVSRREWTGSAEANQEYPPVSEARSFMNNIYTAQNREKLDHYNKPGSESILGSIFKSSPHDSMSPSIPTSSQNALNSITNTSNYTVVSTGKSSPKENTTLLTPLTLHQPHVPEHSRPSNNYYGNNTGTIPDSRVNMTSYMNDQTLVLEQGLINLADVKEEALDYTRGSCTEVPEPPPLAAPQCRSKDLPPDNDAMNTLSKDDASHFLDTLARNPNLQDENAENAVDSGRPYLCPICRKSFAKVAILKRHHLAHFRPYNCHLCPRSFTRREVLAEHVLEHNGADLRLPCPVCKMTIKRKRNLQAHIKSKHPEYHRQKSANNEALC